MKYKKKSNKFYVFYVSVPINKRSYHNQISDGNFSILVTVFSIDCSLTRLDREVSPPTRPPTRPPTLSKTPLSAPLTISDEILATNYVNDILFISYNFLCRKALKNYEI